MSNLKTSLIRGATGAVLFIGGLYFGHIITRREIEREFESMIYKEVEELKNYFEEKSAKTNTVVNNTHLAEDLSEQKAEVEKIVKDNNYSIVTGLKGDPGVMFNSQPVSDAVTDSDLKARNKNRPYVISSSEYMEDEPHFDKLTLKYYEGDNTLADESDMLIDDPVGTLGEGNLSKFGYATNGDPDALYIRNEKTSVDYEVIRDYGKYLVLALGIYDSESDREFKDND